MHAGVYADGGLSLQARPIPRPSRDDLLLRVRAASICATDLKIIAHGHFKIPPGTSRVLGHEFAGEVVQPSDAAPEVVEGMRVGVAPNFGCGRCDLCARGLDHLCASYEALGISIDGALADYVLVPAAAVRRGNVVPLPPALPDEEAALVEPLSCVLNAHEAVRTGWGDRVLVFGAGPMGVMHLLVSRALGAASVVAVEPESFRRAQARTFGADAVVTPEEVSDAVGEFTAGRGFDVVIVAVPAREPLEQALAAAAALGRIHVFAGLTRGTAPPILDANRIHYRQLTVTGTSGSSARQYRRAIDLAASGRLPLGRLVSVQLPLGELEEAFLRARAPDVLKVVIRPGGAP
ncbi:MAG: alcohol dehydrogenase catalytic domain-containing protein [Armatimonadota bacterium]|nr:alcohol dehydrogenase catalytic domain-containing protein [Armatimonadota bacterium]MDR7451542.1 alcohol dehydrogenase catalytic domain-containing protein [Armatimonadota bacterium]MDR7467509.1 alcohol dehydrogenase catalytic domain-containing protein [Armatimonadota bacterium]MDR7494383.1 alcohol dehydrogenase catalytic domain-containing protein [Armatimonadota bacterium]MDR7499200.1 alcohol dehydrogenase catalytic domain-containing protein [Armatimonadota bacterium]